MSNELAMAGGWVHLLLADDVDIKSSYGNLIFMGCFFLALIAALVWWLKR